MLSFRSPYLPVSDYRFLFLSGFAFAQSLSRSRVPLMVGLPVGNALGWYPLPLLYPEHMS